MQLDGKRSVRQTLVALTATLLGAGAVVAADQQQGKVESSVLVYSETNRVKATEAVGEITWNLSNGRVATGKVTFDALTGATPNGAVASDNIQTFTRPSGRGQYYALPGQIPLDNTFKDSRLALDGSISRPVGRMSTFTYGGHLSTERDYQSLGANLGFSRDFNKRNTTLEISSAVSFDRVAPHGGLPTPFSPLTQSTSGGEFDRGDDGARGTGTTGSKTTLDAVFGLTQILDRNTIAQINYSFSHVSGYLSDPYKILSIVNNASSPTPGEPLSYIYENRPGSRTKSAFFVHARRNFWGSMLDASYRYYTDNWGLRSNTIDLFFRQKIFGQHAIQPHFRWYRQNAADVYRAFLVDGQSLPQHASADYRLAAFHAYTVGLQYFLPAIDKAHFSITGEYYSQLGDRSPPDAFGSLLNVKLFPDMHVIMFRVGCSYDL